MKAVIVVGLWSLLVVLFCIVTGNERDPTPFSRLCSFVVGPLFILSMMFTAYSIATTAAA